jgi:hypothetical protein
MILFFIILGFLCDVSATSRTIIVNCVNSTNNCKIIANDNDSIYFNIIENENYLKINMKHCPRMLCQAMLNCDNRKPVILNKSTPYIVTSTCNFIPTQYSSPPPLVIEGISSPPIKVIKLSPLPPHPSPFIKILPLPPLPNHVVIKPLPPHPLAIELSSPPPLVIEGISSPPVSIIQIPPLPSCICPPSPPLQVNKPSPPLIFIEGAQPTPLPVKVIPLIKCICQPPPPPISNNICKSTMIDCRLDEKCNNCLQQNNIVYYQVGVYNVCSKCLCVDSGVKDKCYKCLSWARPTNVDGEYCTKCSSLYTNNIASSNECFDCTVNLDAICTEVNSCYDPPIGHNSLIEITYCWKCMAQHRKYIWGMLLCDSNVINK